MNSFYYTVLFIAVVVALWGLSLYRWFQEDREFQNVLASSEEATARLDPLPTEDLVKATYFTVDSSNCFQHNCSSDEYDDPFSDQIWPNPEPWVSIVTKKTKVKAKSKKPKSQKSKPKKAKK